MPKTSPLLYNLVIETLSSSNRLKLFQKDHQRTGDFTQYCIGFEENCLSTKLNLWNIDHLSIFAFACLQNLNRIVWLKYPKFVYLFESFWYSNLFLRTPDWIFFH